MVDLDERFDLALICPFNVLRERIATYIDFKVPSNYVKDHAKPADFIRLYDVENDQPTTIIHEPVLTTLKYVFPTWNDRFSHSSLRTFTF